MNLDSISELTARVLRHRDERDWAQFHNAKELAVSLCVESAELLALLQWKTGPALEAAVASKRDKLSDELADAMHSLLLLAHQLGIDPGTALEQKLARDAEKYPVHKARGRADKYDEL